MKITTLNTTQENSRTQNKEILNVTRNENRLLIKLTKLSPQHLAQSLQQKPEDNRKISFKCRGKVITALEFCN
jgi:hypothetical protein